MATAKKLPSGNWRVRAYAGKDAEGKALYKSFTETTERKANLAALEWQERYKEISQDSSQMTVEEAIEAHIESRSNILSPSTIAGYRRIKKNRMKNIMQVKLNRLTQKQISTEMNREASSYSAKTLSDSYGLLKAILSKYRPDFKFELDLPTVYPAIKAIPLDDDVRKIYAVAYGTIMEVPILLACWLGLRVSEIRGLRYSDINDAQIAITNVIVDGESGAVQKSPKSRSGQRVLPLPAYVKSRIDTLKQGETEFITELTGQAIYKRFMRICEKAEVGHFRFHDLRHTNATVMLEENVPDKYIAERGGWGSDVYKKRYQHTTANKNKTITDKLDARFETMFSDDK